jgi:cytochrome c553
MTEETCLPSRKPSHTRAHRVRVAIALFASAALCSFAPGEESATLKKPPSWAYPPLNMPVKLPAPPAETGALQYVPDSKVGFTFARIYDVFNAADWFPQDHPPMPDIVAFGRKPLVIGCAYCHLPNGLGKPEDASLAGLTANYILRQMADFKSGARKSFDPARAAPVFMTAVAQNTSDEEAIAASAYFAALQLKPRIRVVETDTVPKVEVAPAGMFFAARDGGTEPIGSRIIELPEDQKLTELQDSRSGYVAYVPRGAVEKGRRRVLKGRVHKSVACTSCHGADLNGHADVPPIAGRSPSYVFRQLYDFREGTRSGPPAATMIAAVAHLNDEELLEVAAFLASLRPDRQSANATGTCESLRSTSCSSEATQ